jgi:hypothetical protein
MPKKARALAVGEAFAGAPYLLDDAAARAYGGAIESPPRRPERKSIHDDSDAARSAGFGAPIAAGEHTYAVLAEFLFDKFGPALLSGGALEVTFVKPVFFGDTLIAHCSVTEARNDSCHLDVWVDTQAKTRVLVGTARVPLDGRNPAR